MAAGALMVSESGGLIGDAQGEPGYLDSGAVIAGTPKVFGQLLTTLAPHLPARYRPVRAAEAAAQPTPPATDA